MTQTGIFEGRVQIPYAYGRFGWTPRPTRACPTRLGPTVARTPQRTSRCRPRPSAPMSLGDYNRIMNQAAALGKGVALLPLLAFALISASVKELIL